MFFRCLFTLFFFWITAFSAFSHPHVFIHPKAVLTLKKGVLSKISISWSFDKMTAVGIIEAFDKNRNGSIDPSESAFIKSNVFPGLAQFRYYTFLVVDGKNIPIRPQNFRAAGSKKTGLTYAFDLAFHLKNVQHIKFWFQDETIFAAFETSPGSFSFTEGSDVLSIKQIEEHHIAQFVFTP